MVEGVHGVQQEADVAVIPPSAPLEVDIAVSGFETSQSSAAIPQSTSSNTGQEITTSADVLTLQLVSYVRFTLSSFGTMAMFYFSRFFLRLPSKMERKQAALR